MLMTRDRPISDNQLGQITFIWMLNQIPSQTQVTDCGAFHSQHVHTYHSAVRSKLVRKEAGLRAEGRISSFSDTRVQSHAYKSRSEET